MKLDRRYLFALITVLGLCVLAEVVLHQLAPEGTGREQGFVGHSTAVPYFVADERQGLWVPNRSEMSRITGLPTERPTGPIRVAAFGGSTIASQPPDGPAWQLAAMLSLGTGGRAQVVNAGGHGFGSTRVRGAMEELLGRGLDAVVLYCGHNEFTESRYVSTLSLQGGFGGFMQTLRRNSRVYEALRLGIRDLRGQPHAVASEVPGGNLRSGEMARLNQRFRANLEAMAQAMAAAGVPGVWVLPASNLGMPPESTDGPEAMALFRKGKALAESGDRAGALAALRGARDLDRVPRRATSVLVQTMREVAARHSIATVDAEAVLFARDPERTLSGGFSSDAMHLDAVGYRIVMLEVYKALRRSVRLPPVQAIEGRLPEPGASLEGILGPHRRTVAAPTLGELEHKPRDKAMTGGR
jgi:lysophospholipase L1-like esterase